MAEYRFDIALSFAGEDRERVASLFEKLERRGIRVFYDEAHKAELWGKDLYQFLTEIYAKEARFTLIFASRHYVEKRWTSHELRAAQSRAFQENEEYILPLRLDGTEIPGIPPTIGYIDYDGTSEDELVELIQKKLQTGDRAVAPVQARPSVVHLGISYNKVLIRSERHEYQLVVTATNLSNRTLKEWHMDLEVPEFLRTPNRGHALEVSSRARRDVMFFRKMPTDKGPGSSGWIMPGDSVSFTFDYMVDDDSYHRYHRELHESLVTARMYGNDDLLAEAAVAMRELQDF
jgi:hypothetical protein